MTCEKCGATLDVGDFPFCPHGRGTGIVVGDEIDVSIKHALCHADGTPRRFRSRTELNRVAKEKGYTNYVQHVGAPGSDKSKFTSRWV